MSKLLTRGFYDREVLDVAREVLGKRLVRVVDGKRISGIITEAEAYRHVEDLACHASKGKTPRTTVMFGAPGRAYVYFTYGMHWMLNLVCEADGIPAAVLIRAIYPLEGLDFIEANRPGVKSKLWCNGPAKLTRALQVSGELNGCDLTTRAAGLFLEDGPLVDEAQVRATPRIGIDYTPEPWLSKPWRFVVSNPPEAALHL